MESTLNDPNVAISPESEYDSQPEVITPLPGYMSHDDPSYHLGPAISSGPLFQLPHELLYTITSYCDQHTLSNLARTCIWINKVATIAVYRDLVIKDDTSMRLFTRLTGADWRNQIVNSTQSCEAYLEWHPPAEVLSSMQWPGEWPPEFGLVDVSIMDNMTSLQKLKIIWNYDDVYTEMTQTMHIPTKLASSLTSCEFLLLSH